MEVAGMAVKRIAMRRRLHRYGHHCCERGGADLLAGIGGDGVNVSLDNNQAAARLQHPGHDTRSYKQAKSISPWRSSGLPPSGMGYFSPVAQLNSMTRSLFFTRPSASACL